MDEIKQKRQVSFLLGIGIVFLPIIFAWFTLRKGYSTLSKVVSFGWLILIFVIVGMTPTTDQNVENKTEEVIQKTEEIVEEIKERTKEEKPVEKKYYKLGETLVLGDFEYVINNIETMRVIGNQFYKEKATEGAVFLIIKFTIKNNSNETKTVMTDDFTVIDSKGRKFQTSSKVNTALTMISNDKDFLVSELQPGLKNKMKTGFEVPQDSITEGLILSIPEKGFLSTGKAEVLLK